MTHVNTAICDLERRYGQPHRYRLRWHASMAAIRLLQRAARQDRFHDVTLLISRGDDFAVIRKPTYPPGVFRPPSGGVEPYETLESGAKREAYEETGVEVGIGPYLVRASVAFGGPTHVTVPWCTHVFLAEWQAGQPKPIDEHEIAEARWASRSELTTTLQDALDTSPDSGLRYRGWVQRAALRALEELERTGRDTAILIS